ncbi:hypothetical protein pb186bvf_007175 [Paramecium bursaria]
MNIYYVRHGESTNNILIGKPDYEALRILDAPLSDRGKQQIYEAAQCFLKNGIKIDIIRCSPLQRAIGSAQIISEILKVPVEIVQNIHEIGGNYVKQQGFPGENRNYFQTNYPTYKIDERITEQGWYFSDKKEPKEEAKLRVDDILKDLTKLNYQNIIQIGHGNLQDLIIGKLVDRRDDSLKYFGHENASITLIRYDGELKLLFYNNYSHLPEQLRSNQSDQNKM